MRCFDLRQQVLASLTFVIPDFATGVARGVLLYVVVAVNVVICQHMCSSERTCRTTIAYRVQWLLNLSVIDCFASMQFLCQVRRRLSPHCTA